VTAGARHLARVVGLLGAVGIGWLLLDARPRDVVLVYDVRSAPGATALEVDLKRGEELVRHARIRVDAGEVRHAVRLREGAYVLSWRLERPEGALRGERELVVAGEGTIVLPLGP
jgi:hypothetical protein